MCICMHVHTFKHIWIHIHTLSVYTQLTFGTAISLSFILSIVAAEMRPKDGSGFEQRLEYVDWVLYVCVCVRERERERGSEREKDYIYIDRYIFKDIYLNIYI